MKRTEPISSSKGKVIEGDLTVAQAAKFLGVEQTTVARWIKRGHLKAKWKTVTLRVRMLGADQVRNAFRATCQYCGKEFKAERPQRAWFCTKSHQVMAGRKRRAMQRQAKESRK